MVFLFGQFSSIEIKVFDEKCLYPIEDIDFLILEDILPPIIFCKVLGVWKLPNWPCSGLNYARFEEFIHIAEKVTRIIVPTFETKVKEHLCWGWFFFQTNFDFLTSYLWRSFFIPFKRYCYHELEFEKTFDLWSFFVELWAFKDWHFGQIGTINKWYISRYLRVSGDLIRLTNRSKLVERSLFAIIYLLQGAKSILLYFIWRMGGWFS